jgi:hypothetical protein
LANDKEISARFSNDWDEEVASALLVAKELCEGDVGLLENGKARFPSLWGEVLEERRGFWSERMT